MKQTIFLLAAFLALAGAADAIGNAWMPDAPPESDAETAALAAAVLETAEEAGTPAALKTADTAILETEVLEPEALETPEARTPDYSGVPLPDELLTAFLEACESNNIPPELGLAVMEQESGFQPDAVSPEGCYGLMQLNPRYFPAGLSYADNIRYGLAYLGDLLQQYGQDVAGAVTAYYYGPSERRTSWYSDEVLERAERWKTEIWGEPA